MYIRLVPTRSLHHATIISLLGLSILGSVSSLIIPRQHHHNGLVHTKETKDLLDETASDSLLVKRGGDPTDFSWITRWAAVGDSFTAGIGSGSPLGTVFTSRADWACSRYDRSYAEVLNRAFGSTVDDFQFVACSGDRTEDIYTQIQNMDGDLDLVVMTAGGNDLCLVRTLIYGFICQHPIWLLLLLT